MSDSDDSVEPTAGDAENVEDIDFQMAFVILLEDFKILFDKRQTPAIKSEKDKAAKSLAEAYTKNTKEVMTVKQVMKKLNNVKTKVKEATDLKKTGNKKIVLTDWQNKFYANWNNEEVQGANPVLKKAPGAVTSGYSMPLTSKSSTSTLLSPPEKKKKLEITKIKEPEEFQGYSLQHLQRMCLIQQIQAARAQESAAIQIKEYYQLKINQDSIVLYTEPFSDVNNNDD
ncbi:unnamed protein product [Brassicogethes aeneus]|uniref:Uncharacterized protein n=1 Tax=Brassicogethes aeneus TaxID=1431903 RepID=A0A9P0BIV6_BRAAE|nr:unnamed protein product [Brassicogethes aeneus]